MILAIDQGTTSTRAAVMDETGALSALAQRAHRQDCPRDGWVEQDPLEILACVEQVIDEAVTAAGARGRLAGVGLANQGETVLLWDRKTGQPLGPALSWQDSRARELTDGLAADPALVERVAEVTGLRLDPYFGAPKLRWLLDNTFRPGDAAVCASTLDSWLLHRLGGGGAPVTDASTAARTLLWDLRAGRWDDDLCARLGVPRELLPEVRASDARLGTFTRGAAAGVPIVAGLVDQPAALLGEGCLAPGQAKATFGTGAFLYMNTGAACAPSAHGLCRTIAWQRGAHTTYALDGGMFTAGAAMEWIKHDLRLCADDAEIAALAAEAPSAGGVVCVPAFVGLAAPHWRRDARAAWLGLGLHSSRAQLVRAALDGIAARVAEILAAMTADAGASLAELRVDGGLSGSDALMQAVADLAGVPLAVSAQPEATLAGIGRLAARASGLWSDDARLAARPATARRFEPRLSSDERQARAERFARALRLVADFQ